MALRAKDLPPGLMKRLGLTAPAKQKFNAVAIVVDGERFDSLKEARFFQELKIRERIGEIENIQRQPEYMMTRDGIVIASFRPDFRFTVRGSRQWSVVDVKGGKATRTEAYSLRKRFVESQYGIEIQEV